MGTSGMELVRNTDGELSAQLPQQFPFRVSHTPKSGRCLVTTREIRPEETVLTDSAILLGPASPFVCIVCCSYRPDSAKCESCGHVLCRICRGSGAHDTQECKALTKCGFNRDMYNIVLPVRFGLLKSRDEEMFEWLMQYMDHNEERNKEMRESTDRMTSIVSLVVPGVDKELAWKIVGILFTNCFEFKLAEIEARALYPLVSLINHSCIPNMRHTNLINELKNEEVEGEIVVMKLEAQRTILANTELTIRYNDYMMGHIQRQKFLSDQWFFNCYCERCRDPTEFGTNTSGLPCTSSGCSSGYLLPQCSKSCWSCSKCKRDFTEEDVEKMEYNLVQLSERKPEPYNIRTCLQQLHSLSKILHNNHFIIINLKQQFLFNFSINMKKIRDLEPEQRKKLSPLFLAQEKYCRQLLTYHEVLDPGQSNIKTKILLELRKVLLIQSRVLTDDPNTTREDLASKLIEVKNLSYLVYEKVPL